MQTWIPACAGMTEPQCDDLAFRLAFGLLGTATSKTKLLRDYRLFLLLFQ